jgi:serine/threonine protein phosphatase 1
MLERFRRLFSSGTQHNRATARPRLSADTWPAVVYAIGDVHGRLDLLTELEALIAADAETYKGEKWIVNLGDYIDRGPQSAGVIAHLLAPPPQGLHRIALAGNHEQMMLEFLDAPSLSTDWLRMGGLETLLSYGVAADFLSADPLRDLAASVAPHIPASHIDFIRALPISQSLPGYVFVHAGIRPAIALVDQTEDDMLWIRQDFLDAALPDGLTVVHGHTPTREPVATAHRIGIDTGAFASGRLTAVRLAPPAPPLFISTGR